MTDEDQYYTPKHINSINNEIIELNAKLPTDVVLKGDGTFWISVHGNDGVKLRPATNEQILKYLYIAIQFSNKYFESDVEKSPESEITDVLCGYSSGNAVDGILNYIKKKDCSAHHLNRLKKEILNTNE